MPTRVELQKGASFALTAQYKENGVAAPIPARYTGCKLQIRDYADESAVLVLEADQTTGITINNGTGLISISIGATRTEPVVVTNRERIVKGQLRLYDPLNADDRPPWRTFDVVLLPESIND